MAPQFGSPISSTTGSQVRGMDPNGYRVNSMYTMGNGMEKYGMVVEKVCDVTNGKMEKSDPKVIQECFGGVLHNAFLV